MKRTPDTDLSENQRHYLQLLLKETIDSDLPGSERIVELINSLLAHGLQDNSTIPSVADAAPLSAPLSLAERTRLESWLHMLERAEPPHTEGAPRLAALIRELLDGKRLLKRPT